MPEADSDPHTVLVTDSTKVADTVVDWLVAAGIAAEVFVPPARAAGDVITGISESAAKELEVRVNDLTKVEEAKKMLSDAQRTAQLHEIRNRRASRTGTVTAVCEDCGKSSEWDASVMGTTENCPHCTAYMDIPDPDDDWSDMDFGENEGEETPR